MTGSVNNKCEETYLRLYFEGNSIPEVSEITAAAPSTVRYWLKKNGVLRERGEGVRLAVKKGRIPSRKGTRRVFSPEWKENIRAGRTKWGEDNAKGVSVKPSGYIEHTRGAQKGRSVHVVIMESRIGRPLRDDECVHHIDGDKENNDINNLALVTRSGHSRLHRYEDQLSGKIQRRKSNGRFC